VADSDPSIPQELHLASLGSQLHKALALRRDGNVDGAEKLLREILLAEPRLAEPRLELAHIAAARGDWEEAAEQARAAVIALREGGQWTMDLSPDELMAFALNLLGELVVRPLEEGDLFLRDQAAFAQRWNECATMFAEAARLDPENEDARRNRNRYRPVPGPAIGEA
jgi:tetratricopeptide (TPR) repeat protein